MAKITAIYRRSHNLGSLLIRIGSWWGPYSHVGVLTEEGEYVIEASALKGVVKVPVKKFLDAASKYEYVEIECPDPSEGYAFAEAQIGKPYDWGAVLGLIAREYGWADTSKWYCSELLEATLAAAGRLRVRRDAHKINVDQSYIIK